MENGEISSLTFVVIHLSGLVLFFGLVIVIMWVENLIKKIFKKK